MVTTRRCSIEDCDRLHKAKGLCEYHYAKKRRLLPSPALTQEDLKKNLQYQPDTGFFVWKRQRGKRKPGDRAGAYLVQKRQTYVVIGVCGRIEYAHRLAFLYMEGEMPAEFVDHKDRDGTNNKWENLRKATRSQNVVNSALSKMSSSGFKGVFRIRAGRYAAHITHHGHQVSLGYFATAEEASFAYQEASLKLRGEFSRTK